MPSRPIPIPLRTALALAVTAHLGACAQVGPATPATPGAPPHHRDGRFQNNHLEFQPKGPMELARWRLKALRDGLPRPPATPTPVAAPDLAFLRANAAAGDQMQPAITWIGHATVLAQLGGITMLTDPIFSQRASPLAYLGPKRAQAPGVALADLPRVDLVVVSHNHYDHMDLPSLKALGGQPGGPPVIIVPLGNKALLHDEGIANVVELDWWQSHRVGPAEVVLTPVQHWSARSLTDRMRTLWGGFAVFTPRFHLFHAGDTGYSPDFAEIRRRFADRQPGGGFDIALLPVGGYEPRWFMRDQHVNPDEAVRIHKDLGARASFGMHWGTFELTDESLDEPPRALADARRLHDVPDDDFFLLAIGQTRRLPTRR
jgi:N-acyl-phosphatidylethanolamine-hydrolysing phospholipase D